MPLYQPPTIPGLTVSGGVVTINDNSADQDFRIESDDNTHMLFVDAGNDRVGIGTNAPSSLLHVAGTGIPTIKLEDTDAAGGYCHLEVNGSAVFIESYDEDGTVGSIIFKNATTEAMRIKYDGKVGIGTTTPASTLDVIGDVRFRASVEVCTSDPAAANIETGTVYQFTKGSAGVFTLPASPPVGTQFVLVNGSANDIVITRPHSSVIVNGATSNVTNTTAYAATSIVAVVSNGNSSEWLVFGGI